MRAMLSAIVLSALVACVDDVGEGKSAATVEEVPATEQATAAAVPAMQRLAVDPAQSKLGLVGAKVTATHPIHFNRYEGEVGLDGEGQVAFVTFTADVASIEADHPKLTKHLKDQDFLWVAEHPTATFESVSVAEGSDEAGFSHTVRGDLTIRGQTKRVTFPANIRVAEGTVRADTEFVIDRQDFGVTYPGRPDDLVQDNVLMQIEFVAPGAGKAG